MKKALWVLVLNLLILPNVGFAQDRKIDFEEFDLPNGLHVILSEQKKVPIVTVSVMYHVGSKNEDPKRTGFAHFFEHLLFEGTENIGRGEYSKYVQAAGGQLNANTTFDRTYYYQTLPSNELELGLWLESERMLHAKINTKGIETQREVVKEERRLRYENPPYGTVFEELLSLAYKEHPYQWPVIGSLKHLNAAKEEEFIDFYKTFYVPNNAVLCIVGDIDIEKTKELVKKYFGEIPKGTKPVPRPTQKEPPLGKEIRKKKYDDVYLPRLIVAYHIPEQTHEDAYAIQALAQYLSSGKTALLNKKLVEEKEMAVFAYGSPLLGEDPGLFIFQVQAAKPSQQLKELEEELDKIIEEQIKGIMVSEDDIKRLRNQLEISWASGNTRTAEIADNLCTYHMFYGDANLINTEIERYRSVTREKMLEVAKKYFNKDNRVVLYWIPRI